MTRRSFLYRLMVGGSAVLAGCIALTKAILPKRYVWAKPLSKYPGRVKAIENIDTESRWNG